jgi:hypothetical protein
MAYVVVPEHIIIDADSAMMEENDETSSFNKVLNAGTEIKNAGLTPIYMLDTEKMDLLVVVKEYIGKKLH